MLSQAPVLLLEKGFLNKLLKDSQLGNVSFWLAFCILGQPAMLFMYYFIYVGKMTASSKYIYL